MLPVEIRQGTLSFAIPRGDPGLKEVTSILQRLVNQGVAVEDYALRRPTLEEAFLQLVGTNASARFDLEGN